MKLVFPTLLLTLAGCATAPAPAGPDPGLDLTGAVVTTRTQPSGDVIEEYRVGTQLRMVKVTPLRGPPYYLMDRDADGLMDEPGDDIPMTYWELYGW